MAWLTAQVMAAQGPTLAIVVDRAVKLLDRLARGEDRAIGRYTSLRERIPLWQNAEEIVVFDVVLEYQFGAGPQAHRYEGVKRFPVMYNDFVLIGPKDDPAGIKGMKDVAKAFQIIKEKQACFVSRGDHSGTHISELKLWKDANIDIEKDNGPWYKSIGQGMGAALSFANASNCYVLSDRGTWIHFKNKGDLQILVEGDKRMFNQYGVMLVNPAKHPDVRKDLGQQFIDWLISPELGAIAFEVDQQAINALREHLVTAEKLLHQKVGRA